MRIPAAQIKHRKQVGKDGDLSVTEIETIGGFHLVADSTGKILGTGPHKVVARHIAKKRRPEIIWTDLNKADWWPEETYSAWVPEYEEITDRMNALREPKE